MEQLTEKSSKRHLELANLHAQNELLQSHVRKHPWPKMCVNGLYAAYNVKIKDSLPYKIRTTTPLGKFITLYTRFANIHFDIDGPLPSFKKCVIFLLAFKDLPEA